MRESVRTDWSVEENDRVTRGEEAGLRAGPKTMIDGLVREQAICPDDSRNLSRIMGYFKQEREFVASPSADESWRWKERKTRKDYLERAFQDYPVASSKRLASYLANPSCGRYALLTPMN
jgi:hypothetical protein